MADNEQPNNVQNFVDKLASGDNTGAGEAFKDALRDKVGAELDTQRKTYASSLFNAAADVMTGNTAPEAEGHSDPKPEVADPLTQTLHRTKYNKHLVRQIVLTLNKENKRWH